MLACRDAKLMEGFQGDGADARGKISMKELFGCRNITKSGAEGKVLGTRSRTPPQPRRMGRSSMQPTCTAL